VALNSLAAKEPDKGLKPILDYLLEKGGYDFSGYRYPFLERRVTKRLAKTGCKDLGHYLAYLQANAPEIDRLVDVLTINVSKFFRDALAYQYLSDRVLPALVLAKKMAGDPLVRVWSAGCSTGEEAYSMAILLHELSARDEMTMNLHIFATDIDKGVLVKAREAVYSFASVENIKYGLLKKYFIQKEESFALIDEIRGMVTFSLYNMLDARYGVPPESVFGGFDVVLCCNLLIYFRSEYQEMLFEKLYHALASNGYLVLGGTEGLTMDYRKRFRRVGDCGHIYQKR
jgi:chemotaxis protein methyltransferase CheR